MQTSAVSPRISGRVLQTHAGGQAGVAATTGLDFDRQGGRRTMRLSFAGSHEDMREAVARLGNWLR